MAKEDYKTISVEEHRKLGGKLATLSKMKLRTTRDLSIGYTPGVAQPCVEINKDPKQLFELTIKKNTVAVVTDGSAVLGLGNIGPAAGIPVMEGKVLLLKEFADVDGFPIAVDSQEPEDIINTVRLISPVFGGVNLEDISAPRCFEIEAALQDLGIPVFHDDQHGTAIVTVAALINAAKVVNKKLEDLTVVFSGAGAAGIAISKMLLSANDGKSLVKKLIMCDSKGIVTIGRENSNPYKEEVAKLANTTTGGTFADAMKGADAFIGVSQKDIVSKDMIKSMGEDPIVLAMANPDPEILPDDALAAGAKVVGTGRSDFPNQINNVLAFPGIFRGALDAKATKITEGMKLAAANALASIVTSPTCDKIIPDPFEEGIAATVAKAVENQAIAEKVTRD